MKTKLRVQFETFEKNGAWGYHITDLDTHNVIITCKDNPSGTTDPVQGYIDDPRYKDAADAMHNGMFIFARLGGDF